MKYIIEVQFKDGKKIFSKPTMVAIFKDGERIRFGFCHNQKSFLKALMEATEAEGAIK